MFDASLGLETIPLLRVEFGYCVSWTRRLGCLSGFVEVLNFAYGVGDFIGDKDSYRALLDASSPRISCLKSISVCLIEDLREV